MTQKKTYNCRFGDKFPLDLERTFFPLGSELLGRRDALDPNPTYNFSDWEPQVRVDGGVGCGCWGAGGCELVGWWCWCRVSGWVGVGGGAHAVLSFSVSGQALPNACNPLLCSMSGQAAHARICSIAPSQLRSSQEPPASGTPPRV